MCEGPHRPRCLVCRNSFRVSKKSKKDADKLCPYCTDKGRVAVCDVCDGYIVYRNCNGKKNSHWMHCPRLILDAGKNETAKEKHKAAEEKHKAAKEKNKAAKEKNKAAEEKHKTAVGTILPGYSEYIHVACGVLGSDISFPWKGLSLVALSGAWYLQHKQW